MRKITHLLRLIYHASLAFAGSVIYGHPSRKLFVVGVTGTKGKSSTLEIMNHVFEEAGKKTALLSSVKERILGVEKRNVSGNTMPGRLRIQRFLKRALIAGTEYAFIEVTSQGVVQWRDRFIDWDAAFFMNLSPEHVESHGSFEKYREAKVRFFKDALDSRKKKKLFFVNEEDENKDYFVEAVKDRSDAELIYFKKSDIVEAAVRWNWDLSDVAGRRAVADWLQPEFNVLNASAAWKFAVSRGLSASAIKESLKDFGGTPGRFELVQKEPFAAVVDYAHTPDSLEKIYSSVRDSFVSGGKLICVLGSAGGGRDKWKRSVMGMIAARYCDEVILTDEDPYDEDPENILDQIEEGINERSSAGRKKPIVLREIDRREAIRRAVKDASRGDAIVSTGKGSESSIHLDHGKKMPWNEREIMKELIAERFADQP